MTNQATLSVSVLVSVGAGVEHLSSFIAGSFDANVNYVPSPETLVEHLASNIGLLRDQLQAFEAALPRTGNNETD